jgi:NAD(P)-dependent dehydrogenase (short-subunit alcohol dehydrogenase family)
MAIGEIEVMVFNVGANVPMRILETDSRKFFKIWEMACFAGFLCGREAARYMSGRGRGTIIFTGATASVRGAAGFAAFASAKHGIVDPADLARNYVMLYQQPRNAWTFELDVRPWMERW